MKFRPCIDIHNGKVKQIVGGSLRDDQGYAQENFVSEKNAAWFAALYRSHGLSGGHVILLTPSSSPWYEPTRQQAEAALRTFPGGLQLGGGVTPDNARDWLDAGASHVIVTSYVFRDGQIRWESLKKMRDAVGRERLVLDLSCRRVGSSYLVMTDRWQKFTDVAVTVSLLESLTDYCDELLIHAVDVEGKAAGIEKPLVRLLSGFHMRPVTYAGGIGSLKDLKDLEECSGGELDYTIGSALDLFGGPIPFSCCLRVNP